MYDKLISSMMKPFFLKMLPDLFDEMDATQTDYAYINIHTNELEFGMMDKKDALFKSTFKGFGESLGALKVLGQPIDEEMAKKALTGLMISRHWNKTIIEADSEMLGDIKITYKNQEVWQLMKKLKEQKEQKKLS